MKTQDWRDEGVHRVTLEFPMRLWRNLRAEAETMGIKPSQLLRTLLAERYPVSGAGNEEVES